MFAESYEGRASVDLHASLNAPFLRNFELENVAFLFNGVKTNLTFELDMNTNIGTSPFSWKWVPEKSAFPFELDIGTIPLGHLLEKVLPFDTEHDLTFQDIYHLEITETQVKVSRDLKTLELTSQTSMGSSLLMDFELVNAPGV